MMTAPSKNEAIDRSDGAQIGMAAESWLPKAYNFPDTDGRHFTRYNMYVAFRAGVMWADGIDISIEPRASPAPSQHAETWEGAFERLTADPAPSQLEHTGWSDEAVEAAARSLCVTIAVSMGNEPPDPDEMAFKNGEEVGPIWTCYRDEARAALSAASSIAPATGFEVKEWVLVPKVPTEAMLEASISPRTDNLTDAHLAVLRDGFAAKYRAMLFAAPSQQEATSAVVRQMAEIIDPHSFMPLDPAEGDECSAEMVQQGRDLALSKARRIRSSISPSVAKESGEPFQARVAGWMLQCFTPEIAADKLERNDRFIEEALELVQSLHYSADRAHALVDYVFGRDKGEPSQEVGGVMVTLAALCQPNGLDITTSSEIELARILAPEIILKIRAKQATKPVGSALPVPPEAKP